MSEEKKQEYILKIENLYLNSEILPPLVLRKMQSDEQPFIIEMMKKSSRQLSNDEVAEIICRYIEIQSSVKKKAYN